MATAWLETLKSATKTCLIQQELRKIHYTFEDGKEMAEEYDLKTNELLVRKWRSSGRLGGANRWEFEIGEQTNPLDRELDGLREDASNPIFLRKDTRKEFQWRIRNLPYPLDNYDVRVETDARCIVIRTFNKKYFKKFCVPDLDRAGLTLEQSRLRLAHANKTLIVSYEKPREIVETERQIQAELANLRDCNEDGLVDCNQS